MVSLELGVVALKTLFKGSHYIQNLTPFIYIYNPVLEHSELQGREKTILKQEVSHWNFNAGRTDHPFELQKVQSSRHQGHLVFQA